MGKKQHGLRPHEQRAIEIGNQGGGMQAASPEQGGGSPPRQPKQQGHGKRNGKK